MEDLKNTINQLILIDIQRIPYPRTRMYRNIHFKCTWNISQYRLYAKQYLKGLNKFVSTKILHDMLSNDGIKLEINYSMLSRKISEYLENNTLLSIS